MSTPESICCSLEAAEKLKEAGWPQDSIYHWRFWHNQQYDYILCDKRLMMKLSRPETSGGMLEYFAAPTAEEILRELPLTLWIDGANRSLDIFPHHFRNPENWEVSYEGYWWQRDESLANAAAAMYCYLAENKLLPKP